MEIVILAWHTQSVTTTALNPITGGLVMSDENVQLVYDLVGAWVDASR
jgi:hypothetical protein